MKLKEGYIYYNETYNQFYIVAPRSDISPRLADTSYVGITIGYLHHDEPVWGYISEDGNVSGKDLLEVGPASDLFKLMELKLLEKKLV